MTSPLNVKLEREEVPLARFATLAVWRIEVILVTRWLNYGVAFATPVAVRHDSLAGGKSHLVVDLALALRIATVLAFIVLLWLQIAKNRRGRDDKRV